MLSAVNANPVSRVRFGNANLNLQRDYSRLEHDFMEIAKEAKKHPVSDKNMVPDWKKQLQALSRTPEANRSLGDYVIGNHPVLAGLLKDEYAKSTFLLEQQELKKPAGNDYKQLNSSFANLEAQTSGMNGNSNALFVGSGPQPNTVLAYSNLAGKVKGIDIDQAAIDATQPIAAQSGGRISFEKADGQTFDYKGYSQVGIAVMVPEKGKVLNQISKTADPGCTVIVRGVDGLKQAMYDGINPEHLAGFEQVAKVYGTDKNITNALLLRKKPPVQPKPLNVIA